MVVIPVPVVAVQAVLVKVAQIEAVTIGVAKYAKYHQVHCPSNSLGTVFLFRVINAQVFGTGWKGIYLYRRTH